MCGSSSGVRERARRYAQLFRTGGSEWGASPARQAALGVAVRSVKSCPSHGGGRHTGLITAVQTMHQIALACKGNQAHLPTPTSQHAFTQESRGFSHHL